MTADDWQARVDRAGAALAAAVERIAAERGDLHELPAAA